MIIFDSDPRLKRGFSNILENEGLVSEARHRVQSDILKDNHDNMYVQTFVLPDMTIYPDDFRAFLEKDLIETSTLVSLEQAGELVPHFPISLNNINIWSSNLWICVFSFFLY